LSPPLGQVGSFGGEGLLEVKFLSRLLTALNLLPSIATMASENRSSWRHQHHKLFAGCTDRRAVVLAEIRDRLEVRRQPARQPHHLDIAPRLPFQSSARLNPDRADRSQHQSLSVCPRRLRPARGRSCASESCPANRQDRSIVRAVAGVQKDRCRRAHRARSTDLTYRSRRAVDGDQWQGYRDCRLQRADRGRCKEPPDRGA